MCYVNERCEVCNDFVGFIKVGKRLVVFIANVVFILFSNGDSICHVALVRGMSKLH